MEGTRVAPELKRGRNRLAATVTAGHAIKHIYLAGLRSILLPEMKIGLGLSATQLGGLAFVQQATSWVTTIVAGYLGDRFSNKAPLILAASLTMMGVSTFLLGYAPNYWVVLAVMLLVGVAPGLYHPPAIGALSRKFPDRRGFAVSLHGTGGSAGEVLGPLVAAGALIFLMWQDVLRASLFPALLGALVVWIMMRSVSAMSPGTTSTASYVSSLVSLLRKRVVLILVLITAFRSMGQASIVTFLPVYLREDLEYSAARVALYLSMAQVVGIVVQPAMGFFSDKFGRKVVLVPCMASLGLLFIGLAFAEPGAQLILTILAMGAFIYSLQAVLVAAGTDLAGEEVQSSVVSLIYGASMLGTVSPLFAGIIADRFGVESAFLYGASIVLLGTVILALLKLPKTATQKAHAAGG